MVKHVVKRDGRVVIFDKRKIVDAILKAMDVTEGGEDIVLAAEIAAAISKIEVDNMSVEDIQDQVENELMNSPRKEVAKKYIAYRNQRNLARKAKSREIFQEIIDAQATEITRENANMNADTPAGMMMKFASESTKSYVDECLLSEDVKEAVKNNYIHIHDKDYYPTKSLTCIRILWTRFSRKDSSQDTVNHVRQKGSRLPASSDAFPWRLSRTRCMVVRPSRPSTSTWLLS